MWHLGILLLCSSLLVLAMAEPVAAQRVILAKGTITSGQYDAVNNSVTNGKWHFDAGYNNRFGVNYSSAVPAATPGSFIASATSEQATFYDNGTSQFFVFGGFSIDENDPNDPNDDEVVVREATVNWEGLTEPYSTLTDPQLDATLKLYPVAGTTTANVRGSFVLTAFWQPCVKVTRSSAAPRLLVVEVESIGAGCELLWIELDLGSNNWVSPDITSPACVPGNQTSPANADQWTGGGTSNPRIDFSSLSQPLGEGETWKRCITDSFGDYWNSDQSVIGTFACTGFPSLPASFNLFYDSGIPTLGKLSQAEIGRCGDIDVDGVPNHLDNCPFTANPLQLDRDGDEVGDACDNCLCVANAAQEDRDQNGIGDLCEAQCDDGRDNDGDGKADYPDDPQCFSALDDDESRRDCSDLLVRLSGKNRGCWSPRPTLGLTKDAVQKSIGLASPSDDTMHPILKQVLASYSFCRLLQNEDQQARATSEVCLEDPNETEPPAGCPPLDCRIDQPGCMDPYPYRRARIPDEAVHAAVLWARDLLTLEQLDEVLVELEESGELRVEKEPPAKTRYPPRLTLRATLALLAGVAILLGIAFAWALRGRRSS